MHALSVRREEINIVAGKAMTTEGQNESVSVWQGFCVAQHGRQVHQGQTKAVKGQNSKTLVTAGTIKRPLPCPVEWIEKQGIFHNVKERQSKKKKRKKIRTKTERKGKKTKKERRDLV